MTLKPELEVSCLYKDKSQAQTFVQGESVSPESGAILKVCIGTSKY